MRMAGCLSAQTKAVAPGPADTRSTPAEDADASRLRGVKRTLAEKRKEMEELVQDLESARAALATLQREARAQVRARSTPND